MSNVNENLLVRGARGNVGKQFVYRRHGNDTNIGRMPVLSKDAAPTEKQSRVRELFSEAAIYARGVLSSADLKKEYEKKAMPGRTAYNMAFRDFLKAHEKDAVESPFKVIKAKKVEVKTHLPFHVDDSVVVHQSLYEGIPKVKIKLQKHQLTLLNTNPNSSKK